jgi:exodeoxyribonuclease V alpha subunit
MADYLARHVPELGKVKAKAIINMFGQETLSILRSNPERIMEIGGIGEYTCNQVIVYFSSDDVKKSDPAAYANLFDLLHSIRPPRRIITLLLKNFGSNAVDFVKENPYRLLAFPGLGWKKVDEFALSVLRYATRATERQTAAVLESMDQITEEGHTKIDIHSIKQCVSELASIGLDAQILPDLQKAGTLFIDQDEYISFADTMAEEAAIQREIKRLTASPLLRRIKIDRSGLEEEQAAAVDVIEQNNVSVLSGVPGSGKSYSVSKIISSIHKQFPDDDVLVVAPTGKAAKRNAELLALSMPGTKITCSTIHKALGAIPSNNAPEGVPEEDAKIGRGRKRFIFQHDESNPLDYNWIFIDESSMADVELASCLLRAIRTGTRVIWVGDYYQLPSVGPGSVLRDLIKAGVPSAILEHPRRNSGRIAQACYDIKEGRSPSPAVNWDLEAGDNWIHYDEEDEEGIVKVICDIHRQYILKYGIESTKWGLQVVSPEKKGKCGCNNLNTELSRIVNKQAWLENKVETRGFVQGDKVISKKNRQLQILLDRSVSDEALLEIYGKEALALMKFRRWRDLAKIVTIGEKSYLMDHSYFVNGDMGEVVDYTIYLGKEYVVVKFINPDRLAMVPTGDARMLLAYSITIHSAQGSGFDTVVIPITDFYWNPKNRSGLWCREIAYTGFSRSIRRLITVGDYSSLKRAISRKTIDYRKTRLQEMIQNGG